MASCPGCEFTTPYNISKESYTCPVAEYSLSIIILYCAYGLIFLIGTLGNGLVIFILSYYRTLKQVTNIYILNLAIADLLFLSTLPITIVYLVLRYWIFGAFICRVFYALTFINWFTGVSFLVVMSIDRYFAVCHAVRTLHLRTANVGCIASTVVWLISFGAMIPTGIFTTYAPLSYCPHRHSCRFNLPDPNKVQMWFWYTFSFGFIIPLIIIVVLYSFILERVNAMSQFAPSVSQTNRRDIRKRRVNRLVLAIILAYMICWLPYWCFQIRIIYGQNAFASWEKHLFSALQVIGYTNSSLNPLLYTFMNDSFREYLLIVFGCSTSMPNNRGVFGNTQTNLGRTIVLKEKKPIKIESRNGTNCNWRQLSPEIDEAATVCTPLITPTFCDTDVLTDIDGLEKVRERMRKKSRSKSVTLSKADAVVSASGRRYSTSNIDSQSVILLQNHGLDCIVKNGNGKI